MYFYFEGTDDFGRDKRGILEASNEKEADELVRASQLTPVELRPATSEEAASEELSRCGVAVAQRATASESLLSLSTGRCRATLDGVTTYGQLGLILTGAAQHLLFSNAADTIEEVTDRYVELPIAELQSVEKKGLFSKRLILATKDGKSLTFIGDITKAYLLIQFSLAESKD